jgi:Flp pilus assembly protein protease CpaA
MRKYLKSFKNVLIALLGSAILCVSCKKDNSEDDEPEGPVGTVVASGYTGNCKWTLTDEPQIYTLTFSGNGAMENYLNTYTIAPWRQYGEYIKNLNIQNGVTTIGEWAFSGCSGLTSVRISNSVTTIGDGAFYDCSGLTSVTIPNSVTTIGFRAFYGCSGLTSVTIPNSVTTIGGQAFWDCSNLTSVTIPNSVTTISSSAFAGCSSLTSLTIPNSVTTIGDAAFNGCSGLTTITNHNSAPQNISSGVFGWVDINSCTLKVPANAVNVYKAAAVLCDFGNIVAI